MYIFPGPVKLQMHTNAENNKCDMTRPILSCGGTHPRILWILVKSDIVNDLILFVGHCDLYFTVR